MSNRVVLEFVGDAADLHRTFKSVDDSADQSSHKIRDFGLNVSKGFGVAGAAGGLFGVTAAAGIASVAVAFGGLAVLAGVQNARVKQSFTDLGLHVKSEVINMAKPLEPVLMGISTQFRNTFDALAPTIGKAFTTVGPYLNSFANGLTGLITNILPGLLSALGAAKPVMDALSVGLGLLGTGLGGFFQALGTQSGPAAAVFTTLFSTISQLLPILGTLIANITAGLGPTFSALMPVIIDLIRQLSGPLTDAVISLGPPIAELITAAAPLAIQLIPSLVRSFGSLVPVISTVISIITPLVGFFAQNQAVMIPLVLSFLAFRAVMGFLSPALLLLSIAIRLFGAAAVWSTIQTVAMRVAMFAWQAVCFIAANAMNILRLGMIALNIVMGLNPFTIIVVAIVALIAIFIVCYNKIGWFRDGVDAAWNWIKNAFNVGVEAVKTAINWFGRLPGLIGGWIGQAKDAAVSRFTAMVNWVRGLPGMIMGAIGNLGSLLLNAGGDLLRGLWNGIMGAANWLRSKVLGFFGSILPGWAKNILGIASPSKVFADIGKWIPEGMAVGIDHNVGAVQDSIQGMTGVAINAGTSGTNSGASAPTPTLRFTGNTSDALATVIMELFRTGKIQVEV